MKKNVKKCFKNLHISKKSCIFASKFSNLCYIKVVFVKQKDKIKIVYRLSADNRYCRYVGTEYRHVSKDFPHLVVLDPYYSKYYQVTKVHFIWNGYAALAWIDKHTNLVVRIDCNKQTKINF